MIKKICPNGHVYDQSIYGDTCPLCPSASTAPSSAAPTGLSDATSTTVPPGQSTRVVPPNTMPAGMSQMPPMPAQQDPVGKTLVAPNVKAAQQAAQQPAKRVGRTVIRHNTAAMGGAVKPGEEGRKLVGFLVTYNRTPMGKSYNIYEGRNMIGRDPSCDICVEDDNQMSGHHMSIRYLSGNNKFRFHDEMSSNGTYVNKELLDDGELQNYDIIRVGSTLFIFIAIPQI